VQQSYKEYTENVLNTKDIEDWVETGSKKKQQTINVITGTVVSCGNKIILNGNINVISRPHNYTALEHKYN